MADELKMVLIAEDEPDNREILRAVVEDILGYKAVLVEDGATALEVETSASMDCASCQPLIGREKAESCLCA